MDEELLAIVGALRAWRHHLESARHKVTVLTDHSNLEHMGSITVSSSRHARWSLFLSRFDFELTYTTGASNARAEALSRRPDMANGVGPLRGHKFLPEGAVVAVGRTGDADDDAWSDVDPRSAPLFVAVERVKQLAIRGGVLGDPST